MGGWKITAKAVFKIIFTIHKINNAYKIVQMDFLITKLMESVVIAIQDVEVVMEFSLLTVNLAFKDTFSISTLVCKGAQ